MARLSHPNIVHIYELGQHDGSYFIAMEFVDGVHTGQLIRHAASEPIPPALVARIGADAAGALAYAHRQEDVDGRPLGLVHRDVSPQNVMISFDGVVKLVDFGIAKAAASADETQPGIVKGKYAYMSPEQTTRKPLDGRSDVFSLGVVMWEMLAGRNIVDRGDIMEAMKVMRDCRFPRLEQVAPHVPPPLAAAVGRALARSRDDRPTAVQLQAILEDYLKQSPGLATPQQLADWLKPRFPRTATTGMVPLLDDGAPPRPARRTQPPPQGTQVAHITGDSVIARAPQGTQVAHITGDSVVARAPTPTPAPLRAATPPPMPRAPTVDDFTVVADALADAHVGDGTTRVVDVRFADKLRPRPRWPWLAGLGALAVIATLCALVVGGAFESGALPAEHADAAPAVAVGIHVDAANPLVTSDDAIVIDEPPDAALPDAPPSDAALAPARATLEILTRPSGARIVVDRERPRTSPVTLRDRAPGSATITASKDGYAAATRTVELAPGQHRTVELVLERRAAPRAQVGYLTARTQPYSVVYLGGKKLGETPFAAVELPVGRHVLTFKHPDRRPVTRTITVQAGKTVKLNFPL